MNNLKAYLVMVVGLALSGQILAVDSSNPLDKIYDHCLKRHGTINNGVVEACSGEASVAAKKQISLYYNKVYNRLLKEAPEDAIKLEQAQKSWIAYRDTHCSLAGSYVGSPMYSFCPMQINIARAHELRELAGQ